MVSAETSRGIKFHILSDMLTSGLPLSIYFPHYALLGLLIRMSCFCRHLRVKASHIQLHTSLPTLLILETDFYFSLLFKYIIIIDDYVKSKRQMWVSQLVLFMQYSQ